MEDNNELNSIKVNSISYFTYQRGTEDRGSEEAQEGQRVRRHGWVQDCH